MLKKLFVILCGALFITDSFATTDIASNATTSTCDSGVLGATEGDVNFDAKWESNNVPLIWHNNNTVIQGLADASNTCNYDGTLTIPATEPQRVGYTFAGWHVMPTINASTLTSLSTGSERWAVMTQSVTNTAKRCVHASGTAGGVETGCQDYAQYNELERQEWRVDYREGTLKGTLYGTSYCSAKAGNAHSNWPAASSSDWLATHTELESASGTKHYCWCQATGWKAEGSSTLQALSSLSSNQPWVFSYDYGSAGSCADGCATICASAALRYSAFRRALFVGAGN